MENVTLKLAEFVSQLTYDQIPEGAISKAKSCVLDALGCALLGSTTEPGKMVNEFVQSQKGVQEASLWSTDFLGPAANVVLGNGTMIHSFDFDDYHVTKIHPGAVVIPAAMAVGEKEHMDGRSLLSALVAGYETMIHISRGANPGASRLRGWHLTGTCGTFAAAAAVGHMWGLNREGMASALGLAGTQSAGLWAFTADGSYSKRFHPGRASQSGVMAAWLARRGYQGPTKILEAEDGGFFKATSEDFDFQKVIEGLGGKFDTEDVIIKPYPACGSLHSSIDATLLLTRKNPIDPMRIKEVRVYNSRVVYVQCGFEYKPLGLLQAQMSMQYCVARAILDGRLTMAQFSTEKLSDPLVLDLARRVRFVLDPEIDEIYPRAFPSVVEIVMNDGQTVKAKAAMPRGSTENPMSWQEVQEKFLSNALQVIDKKRAHALIGLVEDLETIKDISEISGLMRREP